jgi:predicted nuclease of predicted toxin-antitoxin system
LRLRVDEMVPVRVARALRQAGFDVNAVAEHASLRGLSDAEQLARAAYEERVFVTYDAGDFLVLVARRNASGESHPGLVLLRSDRFPQGDPERLTASLRRLLARPAPRAALLHWLDQRALAETAAGRFANGFVPRSVG